MRKTISSWSIKQIPNGTKLDRRSTGSKPRALGKSRSNPEMFNPHHPFVDADAYVASSDVSLAEYLCTHVCLIYVL